MAKTATVKDMTEDMTDEEKTLAGSQDQILLIKIEDGKELLGEVFNTIAEANTAKAAWEAS